MFGTDALNVCSWLLFVYPILLLSLKLCFLRPLQVIQKRRNYGPDERTLAEPFHPRICSGNSPDDDVGICGIAACALSNNCACSASIEQLSAQLCQWQHSTRHLHPV